MRIDLTQRYFNADDDETPAKLAGGDKPVTLKYILIQLCLTDHRGISGNGVPNPVPGDQKLKLYNLYRDIKKAGDFVDLEAEDITLLKEVCKATQSVLTTGQTCDMLEGKKQRTDQTPPPPRGARPKLEMVKSETSNPKTDSETKK